MNNSNEQAPGAILYADDIFGTDEIHSSGHYDVAFDGIEGHILANKFQIDRFLDQGRLGKIYTANNIWCESN